MATVKQPATPTVDEVNAAVEAYRSNSARGVVTKLARRIASDYRFLTSVDSSRVLSDTTEKRSQLNPATIPFLIVV